MLGIDWNSLIVVTTSATVFAGAGALGALVDSRKREFAAADACVGLGVAEGGLTLLILATSIGLSTWVALLAVTAIAAVGRLVMVKRGCGTRSLWLAVLPLLPLAFLAAQIAPSHWDEFTAWLQNAAFLYRFDRFPGPGLPDSPSLFPAYPYGTPMFVAVASMLGGRFEPGAGGVLNVLLLASAVAALLTAIREVLRVEVGSNPHGLPRATLVAGVGAGTCIFTLFNPTFDGAFVLSALADAATSVVLAICAVLAWLCLQRLATDRAPEADVLAIRFGCAAIFLVNLRQSNVVLVGLLLGAFLIVALRDGNIRFGAAIRLMPAMLGPPILFALTWNLYATAHMPGGQKGLLPYDAWHVPLILEIAMAMARQMIEHAASFVLLFCIIILGVVKFFRSWNTVDRLVIMVSAVIVSYIVFLFATYVVIFDEREASAASEFWRYSTHLGIASIITLAALVAWWWQGRALWKLVKAAAITGVFILPIASFVAPRAVVQRTADEEALYADLPLYRRIGQGLAEMLPIGSRVAVLEPDPWWGLFSAVLRYELGRPGQEDRGLRVIWQNTLSIPDGECPSIIGEDLDDPSITALVVKDLNPGCAHMLGLAAREGIFLLERTGSGWQIARTWP